MTLAYVGIGANLGPREETLRRAVELLGRADGVEVVGVSELRETDPVGVVDQPPFLNGAVAVETTLSRREPFSTCCWRSSARSGECALSAGGRASSTSTCSSTGSRCVDEPGLHVPHPRLHERRFALEPLAELEP